MGEALVVSLKAASETVADSLLWCSRKRACDKPNWRILAEVVLIAALAVAVGIGIGVAQSASILSALGADTPRRPD
jgi:hypothetical protein